MTYINATRCRKFLLECAGKNRTHKFTRVSAETLTTLDEKLRTAMINHVLTFPSKGKTL